MAKIQKKLEQHPVAKLFPAPDAAALDALRILRVSGIRPAVAGHE